MQTIHHSILILPSPPFMTRPSLWILAATDGFMTIKKHVDIGSLYALP